MKCIIIVQDLCGTTNEIQIITQSDTFEYPLQAPGAALQKQLMQKTERDWVSTVLPELPHSSSALSKEKWAMTNAGSAERVGGLKGKFALEVALCRSSLAAIQYNTVTLAPITTPEPWDWSNYYCGVQVIPSPVQCAVLSFWVFVI
jgi:hypothetical protein